MAKSALTISEQNIVASVQNWAELIALVEANRDNTTTVYDDESIDLTGGLSLDGVEITATAAEINLNDLSAQTDTVTAAGATSVTKKVTELDSTIATFAATLDAPDSTMQGVVKIIEMTADNGDVTLALTNVQGQSAGTGATFTDIGDTLVLIGGTSKWNVIGEAGVTLA